MLLYSRAVHAKSLSRYYPIQYTPSTGAKAFSLSLLEKNCYLLAVKRSVRNVAISRIMVKLIDK